MSFVQTDRLYAVSKDQSPAASKKESGQSLRSEFLKFQLSTCSLPT